MQILHGSRLWDVIPDGAIRTHRYIEIHGTQNERERETEIRERKRDSSGERGRKRNIHTHARNRRHIYAYVYAIVDAFIWLEIYGGWKRRGELYQ